MTIARTNAGKSRGNTEALSQRRPQQPMPEIETLAEVLGRLDDGRSGGDPPALSVPDPFRLPVPHQYSS